MAPTTVTWHTDVPCRTFAELQRCSVSISKLDYEQCTSEGELAVFYDHGSRITEETDGLLTLDSR